MYSLCYVPRLSLRLLDSAMLRQCDEYHRSYADILYAWQLLDQRAEILKFQAGQSSSNNHKVCFVNVCRKCDGKVRGPYCEKSHCFAFTCSVCNLSVKGKVSDYHITLHRLAIGCLF